MPGTCLNPFQTIHWVDFKSYPNRELQLAYQTGGWHRGNGLNLGAMPLVCYAGEGHPDCTVSSLHVEYLS